MKNSALAVVMIMAVMLLVPQGVLSMEHQKMNMEGDHGNKAMDKKEMGADHSKMTGDHNQMMSHPEMMDDHMKTHHEHIKTMERVFRYERNLAEKAEKITVGYLYKPGDHESEKDKDAMVMMAQTMVTEGLAGKSISFIPIGVNDKATLAEQLTGEGVNVIYIGKNLSDQELGAARDYAVDNKILSIGSSGAQTEQGNTAVGIEVGHDKVNLIISLVTAKQQGINFDPRLYRLADKVIK
jgi:hypothetical protein